MRSKHTMEHVMANMNRPGTIGSRVWDRELFSADLRTWSQLCQIDRVAEPRAWRSGCNRIKIRSELHQNRFKIE